MSESSAFWIALIVAGVTTPISRSLGRGVALLDHPTPRSSHSKATVRSGGYALFAGLIAGVAIGGSMTIEGWLPVLGGVSAIAVMGAIDDLIGLRESRKLILQIVVATGVSLATGWVLRSVELGGYSISSGYALGLAITLLWLVGYTNAFNFMDGVNGMAATHAAIVGLTLAILAIRRGDTGGAVVGFALAGAMVGFLPWNMPRHSIFMGDLGSTSAGFLIALLVVRHAVVADGSLVPAVLPLTPFVLDTLVTFARRILRGANLLQAHRDHYYQKLNGHGWTHLQVTGLWAALSGTAMLVSLSWDLFSPSARIALVAIFLAAQLILFLWIDRKESPSPVR